VLGAHATVSRARVYPEPWASLVTRLGSVEAVAELLGCTRQSVHRYAMEGRVPPSAVVRRYVNDKFTRRGLQAPWP